MSLKDHMVPDGEPVRLTSTLIAGKPFWMPDSREFLFAAHGGLWRLGAFESGSPMRLPFVGQDGQTPVVSKTGDGRLRLVYVRSFTDGNIWRVDLPSPGAPASSAPVTAIGSTRFDGIPVYRPMGSGWPSCRTGRETLKSGCPLRMDRMRSPSRRWVSFRVFRAGLPTAS